ncbi:MAG: hypothetical protein AB1847_17085 [bacterium]
MSPRLLKVYESAIFSVTIAIFAVITVMLTFPANTFAYFSPAATPVSPLAGTAISPVTRYGQLFAATVSFGTGPFGSGTWGGGSLGGPGSFGSSGGGGFGAGSIGGSGLYGAGLSGGGFGSVGIGGGGIGTGGFSGVSGGGGFSLGGTGGGFSAVSSGGFPGKSTGPSYGGLGGYGKPGSSPGTPPFSPVVNPAVSTVLAPSVPTTATIPVVPQPLLITPPSTTGLLWTGPAVYQPPDTGLITKIYYDDLPSVSLPPPITRKYINLDCMGIYAPVDPHNFAVVNNFFRGGVYTGVVTQTAANTETITTPFVQSVYSMKPPVGAVDLNSIGYTPAINSINTLIASPFVTIYGPNGELLSGTRDASFLGLSRFGQAISQLDSLSSLAMAQASRLYLSSSPLSPFASLLPFAPFSLRAPLGSVAPFALPAGYPPFGLLGYRSPLPVPFLPPLGPFGFPPVL